MSNLLLEEYKAYYSLRAKRYEGNANYKNSFEAESELSEVMQGCDVLEDFKTRLGDKNIKCGIALIKDKYEQRKKHYSEMQETIRLEVCNEILANIDQAKSANDIITSVSTAETEGMVKISMDEANREFHGEWFIIDRIEVYENAEVPNEYKSTMLEKANEAKKSLVEGIFFLEESNNDWQPGWRHTPELILEHRHKRLSPYQDEHIKEQLSKYRNYINR